MLLYTALHSSQLSAVRSDVQSTVGDIAVSDDKPQSEVDMTQSVINTGKSRKRPATYKVSINIKYYKPSLKTLGAARIAEEQIVWPTDIEQMADHFEYIQPPSVTMKFLDLQFQLAMVLQSCEAKKYHQ